LFWIFLVAQACSLTGGYVQTVVLSWVAARMAGGLYSLSAYLLACYLPVALLSYPFGRWLDRRPQKGWLLASEGVLAALSAVLWLGAVRQWLTFPFLLIFGSVWGVVRAFQTPIYQSLPRRLAPDLKKGTALLTAVTNTARGVGPVVGGLLYAKWGPAVPFLVNVGSFVRSLILLCFLKLPPAEGRSALKWRRWLGPLARIFLTTFLGVQYNVTFVSLVKQAGLGSGAYGLAMGLLGAGALAGFCLKSKVQKDPAPTFFLPWMGVLNLALAFVDRLWLQGVCIFLYGILDFWYFATASFTLSKEAKPQEITGVMGLYTVVTVGAMPVGALFWSMISRRWGLKAALVLIGTGLLIAGLFPKKGGCKKSPERKKQEKERKA